MTTVQPGIHLGLTLGDPAGIGPEIVLKALAELGPERGFCCTVFGDETAIQTAEAQTGLTLPSDISVVSPGVLKTTPLMGQIDADCGRSAWESLRLALDAVLSGTVHALVTGPIHKEAFRLGGSPDLDHTAMLRRLTGAEEAVTVFVLDDLRVFFLTRHLPLRAVADAITPKLLEDGIRQCVGYLSQLGVEHPRLAVAALNPHGGDGGLMGDEEQRVLVPVVQSLQKEGLPVHGPIPADSVFHLARLGRFDGVLSLYHDQGHIAIKTLDFHRTVSLTLGLPFLRVSVDHGTAMDIAGQNRADARGMAEALRVARELTPRFLG